MGIITLAQLVSPASQSDVLNLELSTAQGLGLQTSTWQPLDPSRTILQVNSVVVSNYATTVNLIAQGGYASYAALMTDSTGAPITTWMDLIANDNFNVPRILQSFASGPVPYTSTSATSYPYSPNSPLKFQNPISPFATYTSQGTGNLTNAGGTVQVQADAAFGGSAGSVGVGTTLILLTPKSGVTIKPQTVALVGTPQESNAALLTRCQAKLGTLSALSQLAAMVGTTNPVPASPGGSGQAYYFVATTIPQASVASAVWPYAVTAPITRCTTFALGGGLVDVFIANSAGSPPVGDVAAVNAAIQALVVPQAVNATTFAATNLAINVTYTVYVKASSNLTPATIQSNISNALAAYFAQLPIGGLVVSGHRIVPVDAIIGTIWSANGGTTDVTLQSPTQDVSVTPSQVPVEGAIVGSVVLV